MKISISPLSVKIVTIASIVWTFSLFCKGLEADVHRGELQSQGLVWVKFEDPLEQAFSVEVPRGWTVRGGLFRMGFSDERPMVDLTSPDGRVNVRLGDLSIPAYTIPNP
jgi:hypothetical protein